MKKEEALILAKEKSKAVIEYIEKILSDNEKIEGKMNFNSHKIDGQNMCTLDIFVPKQNFEKHLNMGITSEHCDILYAQLFKDFLSTFLEHETIGVSKYYAIKYNMQENFTGVKAITSNGSELKINFLCVGQKFDEIAKEYNIAILEYVEGHKKIEEITVGSR